MSEDEDIRVQIAELSDGLRTLMTEVKNLAERVDSMEGGHQRPASAPGTAGTAASRPGFTSHQAHGSAGGSTEGQPSAQSKAWSAKDIVSDKYDYKQPPQDALHILKGLLDDLNAVAPVIQALSSLDLSNVQQVSNWAATNRDTLYMISEDFAARADEARKSLARIASYIDYLKEKAYAKK